MTERDYEELQERFSKKLKGGGCCTNKESAYNEAILACKSILKSYFKKEAQHDN